MDAWRSKDTQWKPDQHCIRDVTYILVELLAEGGTTVAHFIELCCDAAIEPADLTLDVGRALVAACPLKLTDAGRCLVHRTEIRGERFPRWLPTEVIHRLVHGRITGDMRYLIPGVLEDFVRWRQRQGLKPFITQREASQ